MISQLCPQTLTDPSPASVFGLVFAAFAEAGKINLVFTCNAVSSLSVLPVSEQISALMLMSHRLWHSLVLSSCSLLTSLLMEANVLASKLKERRARS